MVENLIEKLRAKGWSPDEIAQALRVNAEAETQKSSLVRYMDRVVYWTLLFIVLVGNFVVSLVAIPFIVFAPPQFLYPLMFLISFTFGALYDLVLWDINKIEGAKQFLPQLLLPSLALINIFISVNLAEVLVSTIGVAETAHINSIIVLVYVLGFMAPFWYTQRTHFWEKVFAKGSPR